MKSIFRIVALLCLVSACAFGTVNVSGTIKDPSGTVVPNSFVRFELTNTNNGQCSVSGASIGKRTADFTANATTGAVSGTLYRNDTEVSCAGSFNTRYNMTIFRKGVPDGPSKCVDVTADFDISAPQYCTTPPPVANPAQYVTAAANNFFSGNNTHSGTESDRKQTEIAAKCDGSTDDTAVIQAAVTAATGNLRTLKLPAGRCKVTSTIQVNTKGIEIIGTHGWRPETEGGTSLDFSGTGPLFQLGADNGHAYDAGDYDGIEGFYLRDLDIRCTLTGTALANGLGNYCAGTYGIRDWRGGDINLYNTKVEHFEFGFWGIQSDLDRFRKTEFNYNKTGAYLGPRSDQFASDNWYSFFNDTAVQVDGAWNATFTNFVTVMDGSASLPPVKIGGGGWARGTIGTTFGVGSWFEHAAGSGGGPNVRAFVEIGVGETVAPVGTTFFHPHILTNTAASGNPRAQFLVRTGLAGYFNIQYPENQINNLDAVVEHSGAGTVSGQLLTDNALTLQASYHASSVTGGGTLNLANVRQEGGEVAFNTLGVRDGAGGGQFRVYGTYTNSASYEAFRCVWDAANTAFRCGTTKAGSGAARVVGWDVGDSFVVRLNSAMLGSWIDGSTDLGDASHRWGNAFIQKLPRTGQTGNTDFVGTVTLSAGSGTQTFTGTFVTAPICVATDTTANASVKASASTTVLTLTGTGTDVIAYHCVGRT